MKRMFAIVAVLALLFTGPTAKAADEDAGPKFLLQANGTVVERVAKVESEVEALKKRVAELEVAVSPKVALTAKPPAAASPPAAVVYTFSEGGTTTVCEGGVCRPRLFRRR